jgi:hypothetical protein
VLTARLLGSPIDLITETAILNIRAHCRHIVIDRLLDWDEAVIFLSKCVRLQDLTHVFPFLGFPSFH